MYLYCIGKVSNCSIKSWVGVDRPIKALSMHIQKPHQSLYRKNGLNSHSWHFIKKINQTLSYICSMCLYCIGKVSNCSIKSCGRSWSAHEGTIYAYTKVISKLIWEKLYTFSQLSFYQKKKFNQTLSYICSMCLYCIGKVSNFSNKSYGRSWSAHEGTIYAYTNAISKLISEKLSKFSQLSFYKKFNQTLSYICSMCLYCIGKVSNCSIKNCGRSWSAHEGTIYAYTKVISKLIWEKLSTFSQMSFYQKKKKKKKNSTRLFHTYVQCVYIA